MKVPCSLSIFSRGNILIASLFIACIINSCKRDSKSASPMPADITQAKVWYESSYPSSVSTNSSLVTQSLNGNYDLSKLIKPDWQHAESYIAGNKNVIEIPVDPAAKFNSTVKIGNSVLNKAYSRSYYLLLNDGKKYEAYILTIFADSAYVKNDLSKLAHNTYRKQDADFSGLAIYFTPKGDYLGGYAYKNGQLVTPATTTQQTGGQKTQSVSNGNLKPDNMVETCEDWYQQITIYYQDGTSTVGPWTFWGTVCTSSVDGGGGSGTSGGGTGGGGGGGGGTSSSTPPPPCPPGTTIGIPTTSPCIMPPSTIAAIHGGKLKVDYIPLPGTSTPCSVSTPPVPCFTIFTDALKKDFPCAVALIINNLGECGVYSNFVQAFTTAKKPDITWQDANLAWTVPAPGVTGVSMLGNTNTDANASSVNRNAIITLNTKMLQSSSQLLIAAAAIHETLHAYINYNIHTSVAFSSSTYNSAGNWLYSLDIWATIQGLPSNYSNHYVMLNDYFSQAITALAEWDNNSHTTKEYAEAMLYGLNNATDGTPAQQAILNTEYNSLLTKYALTPADLNDFYIKNLNATSGKLPTSGCN